MFESTKKTRPKGSRILRALLMALAFGLNLVLLAGVGLYLLNDDDYREILIWSADYFLDGQLEIDGAFSVRIGHEVELTAEGVRLKAYDGSYDLSVARLNLEQRFGSYLTTGTLWINHLNMEGLRGEIRASGNGEEFDWQAFSLPFVVIEEIELRDLSLTYTEFDQQRHTIELSHVSLDDTDNQGPVLVSVAGEINERPLRLEGTLGSLKQLRSSDQTYPVDFILSNDSGSNKQVIELNGTVGHTLSGRSQVDAIFDVDIPELVPIFDKEIVADKLGHIQGSFIVVEKGGRWRIRKTQFNATGTDAYQLRVGGTVESSGQFELHSEFGVPDPPAFGARFGIDLNGYAPFKSKGLISGNKNKLNYEGKMSIGRIESDTALTARLGRRKPQIKGKLNIAELHLADIGINQRLSIPADTPEKANSDTGGQPEPEAENPVADTSIKVNSDTNAAGEAETPAAASDEDQFMLDREPLDFSGLQHFNLDIDVLVDKIIGDDFSIDKLTGQVKLADGALRVSPVQMTFAGGVADLELAVDSRNTPSVSLKLTADDLPLAGVVPHAQPEMQVTGKARLRIDVNSKGRSEYELVTALTGKVDLGLEKISVSSKYLQYLSPDASMSATADDIDTRIEVDGSVVLNFGKQAGFSAEAVRVTTDDGSYDISLGKLDMQPDLDLYLETGTLGFHDLTMTDLHAEIIDNDLGQEDGLQGPDWHEFDLRVKQLPFVLIEKMQLSNLSLTYTRDDEQDTLKLDSLVLDNDDSEEPLQVNAVGTLNALALKLDGTVGTTAQPRGRNQVYPIDLALSSGNVDAPTDRPVIRINGSVDRTLPGTSLMQATFDIAVTELASIFNQERNTSGLGHLQGSLTVLDVDGRLGIREINVASTDTELYRLNIEGAVNDADKLDLTSEAEVPDPAVLAAQFGVDLSGYGPYKGKGVISATRDKISFQGITNIGRIQNDTTLAITLVEGKPFIQGKFIIPDLHLADIGLDAFLGVDPNAPETAANPDAGEEQKSAAPDPVSDDADAEARFIFDRKPMDFGGLQFFNLDLEILIDHITGVDFSIEKLEGEIGLIDGVLRLSPMRMTFEGGSTNLEFELVTRNTPSVMLKVTADDLQLEEMMARMQNEVPVKGKTHLEVDITSSGHSEHELASNLSGKASFALEKARVPKKYVEFLTADLFGFLFRSVTFKDSYATLSCVVTGVEVDQGVAKTMLLFGEGPRLAVDGSATVDLGQETIDLVLLPKAKKSIGFDYSKITMTGSLADPDVKATGTGAATAATIGGAVLIPEIVVPVFLIEQVWQFFSSDDDAGCSDYIEKHQVEIDEFKAR